MSVVDQTINLLGVTVKDRVTSLTGVVVTVSFDLFGCVQAVVRPSMNKEGKLDDSHWFDVNRLEIIDSTHVMPVPDFKASAATPQDYQRGAAEKPANVRY